VGLLAVRLPPNVGLPGGTFGGNLTYTNDPNGRGRHVLNMRVLPQARAREGERLRRRKGMQVLASFVSSTYVSLADTVCTRGCTNAANSDLR
jgi:hypothetical protein